MVSLRYLPSLAEKPSRPSHGVTAPHEGQHRESDPEHRVSAWLWNRWNGLDDQALLTRSAAR